MKARGVAVVALVALLACWSGAAHAYRPFDGTDAAVAEMGEVEIELGPVEYLRDGADRTLLAPDARINYGFTAGWEASLEGKVAHGLTASIPGITVMESDALLKGVLREGSLQEKAGPSIATELGILLPGINDEHGTGASLTGIVSQRWDWGTAHFNAEVALTREQHADYFLDTLSKGRTIGPSVRCPKYSMNATSAYSKPVQLWSGRSGKSKTISQSTLRCGVRELKTTSRAKSVLA
jgi:hypothetical protein